MVKMSFHGTDITFSADLFSSLGLCRGVAVFLFVLCTGVAIAFGYFGLKKLTESP
jgi:hypothetical protein